MFPPDNPATIWWADHAVYVALGYLALGMVFLMTNKTRLMFVCLGCSAAISLFKNEQLSHLPPGAGGTNLRPPAEWNQGRRPPAYLNGSDTFRMTKPRPDTTSKVYESNEF
jgi:hypothetical protein